jgi:hypothetical protein
MIRPGYEVESVPVKRSMPAALESSRGVDTQACTEAVTVQEIARFFDRLDTPAPGLLWVSNNPCQESVSTWRLIRMFFDTSRKTG